MAESVPGGNWPPDFAEFASGAERILDGFENLERAARRGANGCHGNFVLLTCADLLGRGGDPFVRDLVRDASHVDWDLVYPAELPEPNKRLLEAGLAAGRRREPSGPSIEDINEDLAFACARRGEHPFDAGQYLDNSVESRGGRPPRDPAYWFARCHQFRVLQENVANGVFADYVEARRAPEQFRRGLGAAALAVERDAGELRTVERAKRAAKRHLDQATENGDPAGIRHARAAIDKGNERVAAAEVELLTSTADFYAALGPHPPKRPGRSSGRGR